MTKTALLIIDVQNDYFIGGKMPLFEPEQALAQINQLEQAFHQHKDPIIYIQHIFADVPAPFFEKHTHGVQLHADLAVYEGAKKKKKAFPNSFFNTELKALFDQLEVKNVVITGMMTHMCVDATTRAAVELGYHTTVISDATATRDLSFAEQMTSASQVQTALLSAFQMITTVHSVVDYLSIYESNTR